jgi:glycerol-3-phosphate dehydrogenase subunit C
MTTREGSLEAPQRHPLRWRESEFYSEDLAMSEMHRVFDICHGCRRCFNLCNAFPLLFDRVDEGETGELDGVPRKVFWEVVDQCYLCDMCFMTKCPYVPPHQFNLDFPHLMLRAKAIKFKQGKASFRDKLLSSTDALGKLASIPVVVQAVNAVNRNGTTRRIMHDRLGIHKDRRLPEYTSRTFHRKAAPDGSLPVVDGARTPGKVAVFSTCYVNYNEPGMGHDLLALLAHNGIPSRVVTGEACCGMPKLELGDLESVERLKERNIPLLARYAADGYAILTPIPSCTLMFKQELPLLFPEDPDVARVAEAMFDPFEYLYLRHADGLLATDFQTSLGKVAYHIPCHQRVQNVGQRTREMLELVPGTRVTVVERCSGHDGTWGVKAEFFETSMKIGRPVFRQMAAVESDWVVSDCPIATRHIKQGMEDKGGAASHPLSLLRIAYGLDAKG